MANSQIILSGCSQPVLNKSSNLSALPFGFKFGDSNYKIWSRLMEEHAASMNKMGYLDGKTPVVDESEPGFSKWHIGLFIELLMLVMFGKTLPRCFMTGLTNLNIMI